MRLLLLLLLCSCAPHHADGQRVVIPAWVPADLAAEAREEIAAAGLPDGWTVIVRVPVFETRYSPTGIARGLCMYKSRTIYVGWRVSAYEDRPLLPALKHEVGHALHGPTEGH